VPAAYVQLLGLTGGVEGFNQAGRLRINEKKCGWILKKLSVLYTILYMVSLQRVELIFPLPPYADLYFP
jgi:hypothetical protein